MVGQVVHYTRCPIKAISQELKSTPHVTLQASRPGLGLWPLTKKLCKSVAPVEGPLPLSLFEVLSM